MKAGGDRQARRNGSKPGKKRGGKASGSKARPEATYQAEILGQARGILGWTREGNLLLADGIEYVFKPLHEPDFAFRGRKLQAVAALERGAGGWLLSGESLETWLRLKGDPWLADKRGIPHAHRTQGAMLKAFFRAQAEDMHQDYFRNTVLQAELRKLAPADNAGICAVAWFHSSEELDGVDEPVPLREFWKVEGRAEQPASQGKATLEATRGPRGRLSHKPEFKPCPYCGWQHPKDFTQMRNQDDLVLSLSGMCPNVVAAVHKGHEAGFDGVSSSDDGLQKACGLSGPPDKVFRDRKKGDAYKLLFRCHGGRISLRSGDSGSSYKSSSGSPYLHPDNSLASLSHEQATATRRQRDRPE